MNAPASPFIGSASASNAAGDSLAPPRERTRLRLYLLLIILDSLLLLGLAWACALLLNRGGPLAQPLLAAQLMLPIYLTIALHNGTYSLESLCDWRHAIGRMLRALVVAAVLLNFLAFFVKINAAFSRAVFISGTISAGIAMAGMRQGLLRLLGHVWGAGPFNRLVIDAGGSRIDLAGAYRINAAALGISPRLDDPHMMDRLGRFIRNMDQVIVSCPLEDRLLWSQVLKGAGVHGEVASGLAREIGAIGVVHHDDAGLSTLLVALGPLGMRDRATKRIFDIATASLALLLLAPVLLGAMLLIRLEDGGPALFRQQRLGRGNRFFRIYKLRTMRVDRADAGGHRSTSRDDDRITRVGRILRRTSIDELPQLLNVLRGEMSMVGPRPHALGSQAGDKLFWQVDARYWQRHTLRPGITGLAQVRGLRGATERESDLSSRLQADLEYLAGWSIWRDLRILAATFGVLLHDRAY